MKTFKFNILIIPLFMIAFASVSAQTQIGENQLIDSPASIVTTKSKIDNEKGSSCPCQPTYEYNSFEFNTLAAINDYRQSINIPELLLIDHISNVAADFCWKYKSS